MSNKSIISNNESIQLNMIEIEEDFPKIVIPTDNINICFVGGVSTGKSTILNAIFCEELTQCKIKRTTMVPTIYVENESNPFNVSPTEDIFKQISNKNTELIKKTENGQKITKEEYNELVFNVGKLDINILQDSYVNVYDIPGLNDARTKDIYYNYLEENFLKFNLIIFIVDIHSGLNTSDEIDIVNFISNNTRYQLETNNKKIYTLVIVNKADDMQLDEESSTDKLILTGELNEMYEQVEKTIITEFQNKNIQEQLIGIMPLCALDSYLYRMVKKHGKDFKLSPEQILKIGINENGKKFSTLKPSIQEKKVYEILQDKVFIDTMIKLSGFSCLEKMLHKFLNDNDTGKKIRINNLLYELKKLPNIINELEISDNINDVSLKLFEEYHYIYESIKKIDLELYELEIISFIDKIRTILEVKIKEYLNIDDIINDYNKFVKNIIIKFYGMYYDTNNYPEFLKTHVLKLIKNCFKFNTVLTIDDFIKNIRYLMKIDMYEYYVMTNIIRIFIDRCKTNKYAIEFIDNENYNNLIELLDDLKNMNINILELLRFILIFKHKYESTNYNLLFCKKMLYQQYNEIPIYNYISHLLNNAVVDEYIFIYDYNNILDKNDILLETYYLNYLTNK